MDCPSDTFFKLLPKDGISFSYKFDITLLSKQQRWSSAEKYTDDGISGIVEKDDIHPRTYGISSDRNVEDDKKVYWVKYA